MRWRTEHLACMLSAALVLMLLSSTAAIAKPEAKSKGDSISGSAVIDGSYGGGGGGTSGCDYVPTASTLAESPVGERRDIGGVEYGYYSEICDGTFVRTVWIRHYDRGDVLLEAAARAERKLPQPTPLMIWPDPDFDWAYAQVPIDFRAEPADWQAFEATATATTPVETISVTVRAEPATLVFTSGDQQGISPGASCSGDGPTAGYDPLVPGVCHYTYVNASSTAHNGKAFPASVAISWNVNYWSTTDPSFNGTLPAITRETVFPMEVAEVKILGTALRP